MQVDGYVDSTDVFISNIPYCCSLARGHRARKRSLQIADRESRRPGEDQEKTRRRLGEDHSRDSALLHPRSHQEVSTCNVSVYDV